MIYGLGMTNKQMEWARANPDRVRASKAKYRSKPENAAKEREYQREYRSRPEVKARNSEFARSEARKAWKRAYRQRRMVEDRVRYVLEKLKQRAKLRKLEMTLTEADIEIPTVCPVFGVTLVWGDRWLSPSVDRLDNSKGYVKGNVRVISRKANTLKSDATVAQIEALLAYMKREGCP